MIEEEELIDRLKTGSLISVTLNISDMKINNYQLRKDILNKLIINSGKYKQEQVFPATLQTIQETSTFLKEQVEKIGKYELGTLDKMGYIYIFNDNIDDKLCIFIKNNSRKLGSLIYKKKKTGAYGDSGHDLEFCMEYEKVGTYMILNIILEELIKQDSEVNIVDIDVNLPEDVIKDHLYMLDELLYISGRKT